MKKLLKKIKGASAEPRPLKEIQQEYAQVSGQAAQAGYQAFVYGEEQTKLLRRMKDINQEANRRNLLDAELAKQKQDEKDKNDAAKS